VINKSGYRRGGKKGYKKHQRHPVFVGEQKTEGKGEKDKLN